MKLPRLTEKKPVTKAGRILKLLQDKKHVTNAELNRISFRYSSVIHRLRHDEGYNIVTNHIKDGLYEFVYKGKKDE